MNMLEFLKKKWRETLKFIVRYNYRFMVRKGDLLGGISL